ncbi:MAG: AbrB family transcriptional regulator [Verrucomicrobia bacterium]|nr:MAG: AbrB family transcriptional regulator [Verrucomicrobiota bacterium]
MTTAVLSAKFQIVVPKKFRERFALKPGQEVEIAENEKGFVEIRPILTADQLIGFLKGPDPLDFERESDRSV